MAADREPPGAAWEKQGNTTWLRCGACGTWFPVAPSLLAQDAPPCRCPRCGQEDRPGPERAGR